MLAQGWDAAAARLEHDEVPVTKLWPVLWSAYGRPYLSLGLLKLFGDALNFAGEATNHWRCRSSTERRGHAMLCSRHAVRGLLSNGSHPPCRLMCNCTYAGPVLLNALLKYLEQARHRQQEDEDSTVALHQRHAVPGLHGWLPPAKSLEFGCVCVALLGLAAVLKV